METAYPVRKALQFTAEQWERVRAFRFDRRIETEAEAVRRLIETGLQVAAPKAPEPAKPAAPAKPKKPSGLQPRVRL